MEREKRATKKKINHMNADEVRQTLHRLAGQNQSKYYLQVAERARRLGI